MNGTEGGKDTVGRHATLHGGSYEISVARWTFFMSPLLHGVIGDADRIFADHPEAVALELDQSGVLALTRARLWLADTAIDIGRAVGRPDLLPLVARRADIVADAWSVNVGGRSRPGRAGPYVRIVVMNDQPATPVWLGWRWDTHTISYHRLVPKAPSGHDRIRLSWEASLDRLLVLLERIHDAGREQRSAA